MTPDGVGGRIKVVLGKILSLEPTTIDFRTDQRSVDKWDSIRHMNLVLALEDEFEIEFNEEEIAAITSYRAIYDSLMSKLQDRP